MYPIRFERIVLDYKARRDEFMAAVKEQFPTGTMWTCEKMTGRLQVIKYDEQVPEIVHFAIGIGFISIPINVLQTKLTRV